MRFNIRVYAIWIKSNQILLSYENLNGFAFSKFPGGGVEPGEGIKDALLRELYEETGLDADCFEVEHFYTTDFFQLSAFNPEEQIVSVYYLVKSNEEPLLFEKDESTENKSHSLKLEWVSKEKFVESLLTFPIDKKVFKMIVERVFR